MKIEIEVSEDIINVVDAFSMEGSIGAVRPYGSGHINDTFYIKNTQSGFPDYLLQRINKHVFKNVPDLMANIRHVTGHLKAECAKHAGMDPQKNVLTIIPTKTGDDFYKDLNGDYWRLYLFLANTKSYDLITSEKQAMDGGRAFGNFQSLLADLDATLLCETIPDFHNISNRLRVFDNAMISDSFSLASTVAREAAFIRERKSEMLLIKQWGDEGRLPKRITHNDTKFNNVLFNEDDKVQCIIDLDTVMPGYVAFDFGDAIRTIINTAAEDEAELDKIQLNIPLFMAFTQGYLKEAIDFLTPLEVESLMRGVLLLPYMQGVRFLTDHLQGDVYFKTAFVGHNLQRARAQFQLLRKLEESQEVLKGVIAEIQDALLNKKIKIND